MKKIGLISDTHGYLDEQVIEHFKNCDEIWHCGDFGSIEWVNQLKSKLEAVNNKAIIRGVYGNIDGQDIRAYYPENLFYNGTVLKNNNTIDKLHFEKTELVEAYVLK